jgi:hypothetical protein
LRFVAGQCLPAVGIASIGHRFRCNRLYPDYLSAEVHIRLGEALAPQLTSKPQHKSDSFSHFQSDALLDNPIWNSLATRHVHLAIGAHIGMV